MKTGKNAMAAAPDGTSSPRGFRGFDSLVSEVTLPDPELSGGPSQSGPSRPRLGPTSTSLALTVNSDDRPVPVTSPRSKSRRRRDLAFAAIAILLVAGGLSATGPVQHLLAQQELRFPSEWWQRLSTQISGRTDSARTAPAAPPPGSRQYDGGTRSHAPPVTAPPALIAGGYTGQSDTNLDDNPFADLIPGAHRRTSWGSGEAVTMTEEAPPVGVGLTLVDSQIRYCEAQRIRIEAANGVLDTRSAAAVGRFNAAVADYNGRCSNYRYRQGALERVRREMIGRQLALENEGIRSILGVPR